MTDDEIRALARSKPEAVQEVLKIMATRASMYEKEPESMRWGPYMLSAIREWELRLPQLMRESGLNEVQVAQEIIRRLRVQPNSAWPGILRGLPEVKE